MIRRKIVLGPVAVLILAAAAARSSREPKAHAAHAPHPRSGAQAVDAASAGTHATADAPAPAGWVPLAVPAPA